ncbi:Mth938-like domain-containing protein [Puniceibacterium confluentis]|uniref:Mth938-like domain-containing protein n=1 Tax=Puniceibacterium confluentis TaxID=1958944 RepID=UPI0011B70984|nr:Mth938-like domain-containing protein [Puniceibacterium confluentis]
MRMNEVIYTDALPIEGYGPGFFRIDGKPVRGPVCVSLRGVEPWGGLEDLATLERLSADVDVIFVGTGSEIAHLPRTLRDRLEAAGLGVEVMNSPSACRTYNVLLSEGRRVALAVLPV